MSNNRQLSIWVVIFMKLIGDFCLGHLAKEKRSEDFSP